MSKMDWMKLVGLFIAVTISSVASDGARKKIRIHIPQKVKHIHHHKKIYITQHPAAAQYAPAYLPTAEASMNIPTAAVAGILPLSRMSLYEERKSGRLHGVNAANSPLLPLYRARGYYGPSASWNSPGRGVDFLPPPGPSAPGIPSAFAGLSGPGGHGSPLRTRRKPRVKVVKVNNVPRKKSIGRRKKPKHVIIQDVNSGNDEHPVSNFHEQFYSDVETAGTIQKIRKPKRVEKIIDGDTEHIHTYSEEHIHKVVFDDAPKVTDLTPLTSLIGPGPIIPMVSASPMLAIEQTLRHPVAAPNGPSFNPLISPQGAVGSMGTPPHLEYMAYNPHEVTHDHSYHDHGETVDQGEFMKDFDSPQKPSYNKHYPKTSGTSMPKFRRPRPPHNKWVPQDNVVGPPKQYNDYPYSDNLNVRTTRPKKHYKPYQPPSYLNSEAYSADITDEDYRPYLPRPKDIPRHRNVDNPYSHQGARKPPHSNRPIYHGNDIDFSTSSSAAYESPFIPTRDSYSSYKSPTSGFTSYRDQFSSFKDIYTPSEDYAYDNYAAPSTAHKESHPLNIPNHQWPNGATGKKKSISTQNISFGGHDHKMVVDHMADSSNISPVIAIREEPSTTEAAIQNSSPTIDFTLRQFTPEHDYYSEMAVKAFEETPVAVSDPSQDTYQVVREKPRQTNPSNALGTTTSPTTTTVPAPMVAYTQYTSTVPTAGTQAASFVSTHTMKVPKKSKKTKTRRTIANSDAVLQKHENPFQPSPFRQRKIVKPYEQEKNAPVKKLRSYERVRTRNPDNSSRNQQSDVHKPQQLDTSAPDGGEHKYGDRL